MDPGEPPIFARVTFEAAGCQLAAELVPGGWRIPGMPPELEGLPAALNRLLLLAEPGGPTSDPIASAAADAARLVGGRIDFIRRPWG